MIPQDWLKRKFTIADIENANSSSGRPFNYLNKEWNAMKAAMKPVDEVWSFSSSPASWSMRGGRAGVAVVREGEVVAVLVTRLN